jgi:hypothetical protein
MLKGDTLFSFAGIAVFLVFIGLFPNNQTKQNDFPERVKISLREVGNQLLLAQKDSTSLVFPIVEQANHTYELSFETTLEIGPSDLLDLIKATFYKASLPNHYRVEVLQCSDGEVAYSYEMKASEEESIIPCRGRTLPKRCYTVKVHFIESTTSTVHNGSEGIFNKPSLLYLLLFVALVPVGVLVFKKKRQTIAIHNDENAIALGSFTLYPAQHLLINENIKIPLSKKECELLIIFAEKPNQIIPREELTKKVWEDNGVIVGRSLDTYISKLRKKLQADPNLQITNVHGVGYTLEILY